MSTPSEPRFTEVKDEDLVKEEDLPSSSTDKKNEDMTREEVLERRRKRRLECCRINQKRYRERKKKLEMKLKKDIRDLEEEIARAIERKRCLQESSLSASVTQLSDQLRKMEIFSDLYRSKVTYAGSAGQRAFLLTNFAPKFQLQNGNTPPGVEQLHIQWSRYSQLFPHLIASRKSIKQLVPGIIECIAACRLPLTRAGMQAIFPHAMVDEELVQRVIGKSLEYDLRQITYFDDNNQVSSMRADVDFIGAWHSLLGSLHEAAKIICNSPLQDLLIPYDKKQLVMIKASTGDELSSEDVSLLENGTIELLDNKPARRFEPILDTNDSSNIHGRTSSSTRGLNSTSGADAPQITPVRSDAVKEEPSPSPAEPPHNDIRSVSPTTSSKTKFELKFMLS